MTLEMRRLRPPALGAWLAPSHKKMPAKEAGILRLGYWEKSYFTRVRATSRTGAITSGTFSIFTDEVSSPKYWASPEMNCLM